MSSYKYKPLVPLSLRDRMSVLGGIRRKFALVSLVISGFAIALLLYGPQHGIGKVWTEQVHSVWGTKYSPEDEWAPPENWDPIRPVYKDFKSLDEKYTTSIRKLRSNARQGGPASQVYRPYPGHDHPDDAGKPAGKYTPCRGPRGKLMDESTEDAVYGYVGRPPGFPEAQLGDSKVLGIDEDVCFDRHGRYGAYGLRNPSMTEDQVQNSTIDWNRVDWSSLQQECLERNHERFNLAPRGRPGESAYEKIAPSSFPLDSVGRPLTRSAILFRAYEGMKFTGDMIRTMRAVIMEAGLGSGGEFEAFVLFQVKNVSIPIFEDHDVYKKVLEDAVPEEFWGLTVLWNEALWEGLYPRIPQKARDVHHSQWLPVQWFSSTHNTFDHYWNWEMDVRYTGHHYDFLTSVDSFARAQPRKGLWERNSRFYIPKYHGSYSAFSAFVQQKYTSSNGRDESIWGPHAPPNQPLVSWDDLPPLTAAHPEDDKFQWGVEEEADLITMLPQFDPNPTHYSLLHGHWNYPVDLLPDGPPRRTTIITFNRLSHRLLSAMHLENVHAPGHHMSSESWPHGVALHHGFKSVHAPHSIHMGKKWPAKALEFIFNNGDADRYRRHHSPPKGEGSGGAESVFGLDREHNWDDTTFYYSTALAAKLYKRLMGHKIDGVGGPEWEKQNGLFCLPPMLLHPIKAIEDPDDAPINETSEQPR